MQNLPFLVEPAITEMSEPLGIGRARLKKACRNQVEFSMSSLDDLICPDHPVRQIWEYVDRLDLSRAVNSIKSVEGTCGRPAIDPKILTALWLYATVEGVGSAYVLADLVKEHIAFKWICGSVSVDRKTISQFRVNNGFLFEDILAEGITILIKAGAVSLNEIAQDGLRVRACAGRSSFKKSETVERLYKEAKKHVLLLREELEKDPAACKSRQFLTKKRAQEEKLNRLELARAEFKKYEKEINSNKQKHKKKS